MPRTVRLDIPGQLYHITDRGVERRDLFLDDQDRESFLARFSTLLTETNSTCLAWSLMLPLVFDRAMEYLSPAMRYYWC